jgi:drug/metabolite transporter (DMT)-like permease
VTQRRAELLLVLVTVLWGGTFAIVKEATHDASPSMFVAMRFLLASVLAMLLWPKAIGRIDRTLAFEGVVLGLFFGVGYQLQTFGLTLTTASASAFITGTTMMFVPIIGWVWFRTPLRKRHFLSITIVAVGLYGFTRPDVLGINNGDIATLASAIVWAVYIVLIDRWAGSRAADPTAQYSLVILQFVMATALASAGIVVFDGPSPTVHLSTNLLFAILYCSVFATVVATSLQTRFQGYTQPVRAGLIFAAEPLAAAAVALFAFGEVWDVRQTLSAVVMIVGIVIPDAIALSTSSKRSSAK